MTTPLWWVPIRAARWCLAAERPERVRGLVSISAAHPVDLRRAIAARPWDFGWINLRSLLCRLPRVTRAHNLLLSPRAYRKELDLDTGPSLADATLDRILDLRLRASRIGSVRRGILWNHRMRTAVVPLTWVELTVERPVLFIHAQQRLWNPWSAAPPYAPAADLPPRPSPARRTFRTWKYQRISLPRWLRGCKNTASAPRTRRYLPGG